MNDEFNYISDQRTLMHLSQGNILGSVMVFLLLGRHKHWSLAMANMQTKKIYHKYQINGIHSNASKDGGTFLLKLLVNRAKHKVADFDERK